MAGDALKASISSKERSRAASVFRRPIWSCFGRGIVRTIRSPSVGGVCGARRARTQPRPNRFQRTQRRRSRRPSRARHRTIPGLTNWQGATVGRTARSSRPYRTTAGSPRARVRRRSEALRPARAGLSRFALRRRREKNRRRSARSAMRNGRARKTKPPPPSSITRAKCSRCRRSAKRSPATPLAPTRNGRPNSNIHSRSAKRRTR